MASQTYILHDRIVEQVCILGYERDAPAQVVENELIQAVSSQRDAAASRIPEAHHQVGAGRLARSGTSDDRHSLPRADLERHAG